MCPKFFVLRWGGGGGAKPEAQQDGGRVSSGI